LAISGAAQWAQATLVPGDIDLLARLLTVAALIGGTIEYAELMARRVVERRVRAEIAATQEAGLRGLVRISLQDRG
jgi:hypothetical protein